MKKRIKKRITKVCRGSISILLSLLLTGICSLTALVMEAGRYRTADQIMDDAAINSAMSLIADFDSTLQKRFGLYAVKSRNGEGGDISKYMSANSDSDASGMSFLYNLIDSKASWKYDLANYSVLERQMLEYEKYRAPAELAEELFNIDKIIKELKEKIEKMIPMLENLLEVVDAACDLLDALKELYTLYKTIQQIEASIFDGKGGFENTVNQLFGKGWEAIETGFFNGKKWETADPSYYISYRALNKAIGNKIDYMNSHNPAPQPPAGDRPSVDDINRINAETLEAYYAVLSYAVNNGYFDANGLVDADAKIDDLVKDTDISSKMSYLSFLNKDMTRSAMVSEMANAISGWNVGSFSATSNRTDVSSICSAVNNNASNSRSTYSGQVNAQNSWDQKNKAYNEYQEKLKEYNEAIDTEKKNLTNALTTIAGELGTYKGSVEKCKEAVQKAVNAVQKMKDNVTELKGDGDWSAEDISKIDDVFQTLINMLTTSILDNANEGMDFIANQKAALEDVSGEKIDTSYGKLADHKNLDTGKMEYESGGYYLSKTEMSEKLIIIGGLSICRNMESQLISVMNCFKQLQQAFSVIPALFDPECVANLDPATTNLFPSKTGTNSEENNEEDLASIEAYLNDARSKLGAIYEEDIGLVDPNNVSESDLMNEELTERISRIADTMQEISGDQDSILAKVLIIPVLVKIVTMAPKLVQLIEDVIFVSQHIGEVLLMLPQHLGESVLLNQYAVSNFSNRLDKVKGEQGVGRRLLGIGGEVRKDTQTFSQANLEYILAGGTNEAINQEACFNRIFALRLINNAILIALDSDWMEIISACNFLAPVVFLVLLYIESNMDMNLLIKLKMEIPLIKTKLILSFDHLAEITESLTEVVEIEEFDYEDEDCVYSYYSEKYEQTYTFTYEEWRELGLETTLEETGEVINKDTDIVLDKNASALSKYYATKEVNEETQKVLNNLEEGLFKLDYKSYLFLFMFFQSNRLKVKRMADLIQMELRYTQMYQKANPDVLLSDYHTFVRVQADGTLHSVLPVISLGKNGINKAGWKLTSVKYVGY